MKRRLPNEDDSSGAAAKRTKSMHRTTSNNNNNSDSHVNELLKQCLQKVCELQAELAHQDSSDEDDAEAAGYAACAVETLRFLAAEGLTPDNPVIRGLSQRLLSNER